jgi:hypothetical protein
MVPPWLAVVVAALEPGRQEWRKQLLWAGPTIAGILVLAALVIAWVKRWSTRRTQDRLSSGDQLTHFRTLYEQGELGAEEFSRIRSLLAQRLKRELDTPDKPPAETQPPEPHPPHNATGPNEPAPNP